MQIEQSFLPVQHARLQVSLDGARLRGFCEFQKRLFFVFMYPCKPNHASSEKNVSCRSISLSVTHFRNQLQKWTLLAGSRSCKAWITIVLHGLSCSSCVSLLHSAVTLQALWARHWALSAYSFVFLCMKNLVNWSLFTKLWMVFLLGTLSSQIFSGHLTNRIVFDISVIQKYMLL
jgi:hypothetical protein